MDIWIKPYRKRDGELMYFINNERGVSIGISHKQGYMPSKATQGQKKLWQGFHDALKNANPIAEGCDLSKHNEPSLTMRSQISFVITDVAVVGNVKLESDGLYVVKEGKIYQSRFRVE